MSGEQDTLPNDHLLNVIKDTLNEMESRGDIVICSNNSSIPARFMHEKLIELLPSDTISASELSAIRTLVLHAIIDKRFFDWEMPNLTGFDAQGFARIAEKLPKG